MSTDPTALATRFEDERPRLQAVAFRMLGSTAEADDAVQEAWLRLTRVDAGEVSNLAGWLTTVVSRVCLDQLRSRTSKREVPLEQQFSDLPGSVDPEQEALLADAVGPALLLVLDALGPAERVAFVLHDLFAVPFEDIAPMIGRSVAATRQLASRARRRVRGEEVPSPDAARQRRVVEAFLAASRAGDFASLLSLLDPDVVVRSDEAVAAIGPRTELAGAQEVASFFNGRAVAARPALLGGLAGLVWAHQGVVKVAFRFTLDGEQVTAIELIADEATLAELEPEFL